MDNYRTMNRTDDAVAEAYDLTAERGFLPERDPLTAFDTTGYGAAASSYLQRLDEVAAALPDHVEDGDVRSVTESLDAPPDGLLDSLSDREATRACQIAGFYASAYANQLGTDPVDRIPAGAAVPLYECSKRFGRKPILSYDLLCLRNYRRKDPSGGFDVENLDALLQFRNLEDERWFVVVHVAIESAAGPALVACSRVQRAVEADDPDAVLECLETVADSLDAQTDVMERMTEGNDPGVFATEFRPFYEGFDDVVYEGVDAYSGEVRSFRGGSGAQSSVLPSIDATLGIDHESSILIEKLRDMHTYMSESHRSAVAAFRSGPDIRPYVADQDDPELEAAFNRCARGLSTFRRVHLEQVIQYIREVTNETEGTGGTEYMPFLEELRAETEERLF